MLMNKLMSDRIKILNVLSTFLVVWRHSTNMVAFYGGYEHVPLVVSQTEWTLSQLTNVAVPLFFVISGFFFFRRSYYEGRSYIIMLKKKSATLLIPFIIWNIIGCGILFVANEIEIPHSVGEVSYGIYISDYDRVLWFVRNLMLMMLLYPLYGWVFVINRWQLYFPLLIGLTIWWIPDDCSIYSSQGWLFFLLGGMISNKLKDIFNSTIQTNYVILSLAIWIALCISCQYGGKLLEKLTIILGMISVFGLTGIIPKRIFNNLLKMSPYCFFIYVTHTFLIKALKITVAKMYPNNEIAALLAYFLLPLITFICLLWLGKQWKRLSPKLYGISVGGRG